jgi:hypothetical protein
MAAEGGLRVHTGRSAARRALVPRGALRWMLAVLAVLGLHALTLQELAHLLPGTASEAPTAQATRAFVTRTVRIDNAAPKAAPARPAAAPVAPRTPKMPKPPTRTLPPPSASPGPSLAQAGTGTETGTPAPGLYTAPVSPDAAALAPAAEPRALIDGKQLAAEPASAPAAPAALAPAFAMVLASAASSPAAATAPPVYDYLVPGSTRLKYELSGLVKGFSYHVSSELLWLHDGKTYDARLEISHFLLGSRVQTSKGAITAQGLEPLRFGDKVRSEVAAHFQRAKGVVSFSANTPDVPLLPLAQDQLSIFMQLAAMWGGNAARFAPGMQLPFQAVGPRSAEFWVFVVGPPERLKVEGRELASVKLLRERTAEYDVRVELWLAPALDYLPARIRLTQSNGDEVDMLWRKTEKP